MRVLITRPAAAAQRTAKRLLANGHVPLIGPVMAVTPTGEPMPHGTFQAVLATSTRAFIEANALATLHHVPLLAVGSRTAAAAREAGFADVRDAQGDAADLARLAASTLTPPAHLLVLAGRERSEALDPALIAAGFAFTLWTRYAACRVAMWDEAIVTALKEKNVEAVLHYSPRSAAFCLALAAQADVMDALRAVHHVAMSPAVAAVMHRVHMLHVHVASHPDEAHLLAMLDTLNAPAQP